MHYNEIQGVFFYCSALKMTKCQPDREIWELFLPKKRPRMKKVKVPELFRTVPLPKMTKEKVQVTQLLWWLILVIEISWKGWPSALHVDREDLKLTLHYLLLLTFIGAYFAQFAKLPNHCGDSPLVWKLGIKSNLLLLSREVVYSVHYWRKCLLTREVEMHEYTCAVVSVLILCFFLWT